MDVKKKKKVAYPTEADYVAKGDRFLCFRDLNIVACY